jgi:hypothetical protein
MDHQAPNRDLVAFRGATPWPHDLKLCRQTRGVDMPELPDDIMRIFPYDLRTNDNVIAISEND